jgi:integrase/recombinase XerD
MKLYDAIAEYVAHRESIGQNFTGRKSLLRAFNRAVGCKIEIHAVNPKRVRAFLGHPSTCYWSTKYSTLTCFYRYAISRGHVDSAPLPKTIPKISTQFVPYIYTHDEVRRLLEATKSYRNVHRRLEPHTFRVILLLLYGAGLRVGEALSLRMADVDLTEAVLLIRGSKFYKSRLVPISPHLKGARYSLRSSDGRLVNRRCPTPRSSWGEAGIS